MAANPASCTTSTPNSIIERLFHHAEVTPSHHAVVTPASTLSYEQLAQLVRAQAEKLCDAGISGNSVIGITCTDDSQHLVLCLAAAYIGATSITVPSHEAEQYQDDLISRCGVTHSVDEKLAVISMSPGSNSGSIPVSAPTACLLFSTSGTTGNAKLVIHYDSDLVAQAHRHIGSEQERFVCLASMEHNFAKRHRLYCVAAGATNIFLDKDRDSLVAQCLSLNVNVLHVSAFQAQELLAIPDISKLSNIRLKLGGSHVPAPLREQLRNSITRSLHAGYGTTETGAIAFTDPDDLKAGESVGQSLPGIEIRAVTPDRKTLGAGEHGELAVRCDGMFRGYSHNPDLTAAQLEDGWFYTGDIGYLDSQQRVYICGRSDDMFVFNSMNIYPQDIESQIRQHPGVADAAVLPKTSSVHGQIPVALVVISRSTKLRQSALKKFVRKRVGVRCPRQFIIVDEIPRNASGKISRREAAGLSTKSDQVRESVIDVVKAHAADQLNPALIKAFERGESDITLREIDMDSLARMEMLIALEIDYDAIITPQEFREILTLGDIVAHVLSLQSQHRQQHDACPPESPPESASQTNNSASAAPAASCRPYVIRFFQRTFSYCHTVAQLNQALTTLEHRLTPTDIELLYQSNCSHQLIPSTAAAKFHTALTLWLQKIKGMMLNSGKQEPEPFVSRRVAATLTHYAGPGSPADKALLVCFTPRNTRYLMMPNAVLLQHADAARFDLLIVTEPLNEAYRRGAPILGGNVTEMIESIAKLKLISNYSRIRTLGCSAGCYPAVIAGYLLGGELAVGVGGRFHSWRHPGWIAERIVNTWRAVRRGNCARVLMCYDIDKTRDRNYSKLIAWLSGGSLVAIEFADGIVGHRVLSRLLERGELAPYLARTVFAEMDDELIATQDANAVISFQAGEPVKSECFR
jgi:acyl-coenzyme A synthetase/AMP-(fatty) acid ligase